MKSKEGDICYEKCHESFALHLKERGVEEIVQQAEEVEDRWSKGKVKRIATDFGEFLFKEKRCCLLRGSRLMREFRNGLTLKAAGVPVLNIAVCVHSKKKRCDYGFIPYISESMSGLQMIKDSLWQGFSASLRRSLIKKIASVVGALHSRGFSHGDLNPSNILFTDLRNGNETRIFLIDFGGARRRGDFSARVKDLARLWRSAEKTTGTVEGIRFLKEYLRFVGGDLRSYLAAIGRRLRKIKKG